MKLTNERLERRGRLQANTETKTVKDRLLARSPTRARPLLFQIKFVPIAHAKVGLSYLREASCASLSAASENNYQVCPQVDKLSDRKRKTNLSRVV